MERLRRIIVKSITNAIKPEIMIIESACDLQSCAGQQAGYEATVHVMSQIFAEVMDGF